MKIEEMKVKLFIKREKEGKVENHNYYVYTKQELNINLIFLGIKILEII